MERQEVKKIIEALLYMTDHALSSQEIAEIIDLKQVADDEIKSCVTEIRDDYDAKGSPIRVVEVAGGFQMATRPEMAQWVRRMYKERLTVRLSPSALETLSIIAYKQPITRSDIEQIRGVEGSGVMETLLERRLIKVVGRKETIGRPLLYGTTIEFLRQFGLKHLAELPDIDSVPAALSGQPSQQQQVNAPDDDTASSAADEEQLVMTGVASEPSSVSESETETPDRSNDSPVE